MDKSQLVILTPLDASLADYIPHPDNTLPGRGSAGGEHPEHPIYYPPEVAPPIVLPPEGEVPPEGGGEVPPDITERFDVKVGWTAETGWVVVFVPTGNVPTPSRRG